MLYFLLLCLLCIHSSLSCLTSIERNAYEWLYLYFERVKKTVPKLKPVAGENFLLGYSILIDTKSDLGIRGMFLMLYFAHTLSQVSFALLPFQYIFNILQLFVLSMNT